MQDRVTMRYTTIWSALCLSALVGCSGQDAEQTDDADQAAVPSPEEAALESVRQATAKYEDVTVATQEGYIPDPSGMCVDAAMVGAPASAGGMGIHYLKPELLGVTMPPAPGRITGTDAVIDESQPDILLYEPQADGSHKLIGIEYLVFEKAWQEAGNTTPPSFAGNTFVRMVDDPATEMDEAHGFEPHYELHVWLFRENPSGPFAEFNPNVTCPHAAPTS
jgi:hypothetical protein